MRVSFGSVKLEKLCGPGSCRKLQKRHGQELANALFRLLADLAAAQNLGALPPSSRPHPLQGARKGQFSLRLPDGKRLLLTSLNQPPPLLQDGSLDWHAVDHVQIESIENYHRG